MYRYWDAKGSIREIILPKGLDLDRPKRTRTSFTAEQLYRLEMEFQRCQYVVGRERTELARQLNLSETQGLKKSFLSFRPWQPYRIPSDICVPLTCIGIGYRYRRYPIFFEYRPIPSDTDTFKYRTVSLNTNDYVRQRSIMQVKVWFQNRRTKQKKDQGKDSELRSVVSETAATCSVLRLLEQGRLLSPPGLPGLIPACATGALRAPSSSGPGAPSHPDVTSSPAHQSGLHTSPTGHSIFSMPVPSLLGTVTNRLTSNPLTMAGNLQELSARYLSSSAFEPYSRSSSKETLDKKSLD
ncbi:unnamed protein product [Ranitomeya imitator]|uniref:Homeobox domain-containing protein n=1 Tax=Ranitomeya imitator TaxID=111125 RepID=A0ABN9LZY6_9NEOB|nr:unnamed protein product [Ranitomeya imitator]